MRNFTVGHLGAAERALLREVALTYRRCRRQAFADGKRSQEMEHEAYEAALAAYFERLPGEKPALREASARVSAMIAAAINANTDWFWHGPDA